MPNEFNTIEEARAEILRLNEELTERTNERDTLSENITTLSEDNERLRKLNHDYFNKLSAQYNPTDEEDLEESEPVSLEEYAKSITI